MKPPKPCLICGKLTQESRCEEHRVKRPDNRVRHRPGHRTEHAQARRHWKPFVELGTCRCSRCGAVITSDDRWDIDRRPWGFEPSHARCNRAAGGRGEA